MKLKPVELAEVQEHVRYYIGRGVIGEHWEFYRGVEKLLNAYESPTARDERSVLKAAIHWGQHQYNGQACTALERAVRRLLAARAKAKKAGRK